jgi:tetratricopeptide (TPR) repeat protein
MSIENNLLRANDLLGRGKLNDALLAVQDVLRTAPRHASAHHLQARLLWSLGRKQDALGAAHAAQQLDPQSAGIAAQLGEFYVELRLPEFALPLLQGAVARAPAQHEANLMLGRCYMEMDKGYRALPHFETALETATSAAQKEGVTLQLAECLYAINESARADALLDDMIASAADAPAFLVMRGLNAGKQVPEGLVARLAKLAESEALPASERANAFLAMGRCLDNQGRHVEAFDLWAKARALLKIEHHSAEKLRIQNFQARGLYAKELIQRAATYGEQSESPIFIVGMPRSGTTLTAQVIGAHPQCISIGETDRFNRYDKMFRQQHWHEHAHRAIMDEASRGSLRNIANEFKTFFGAFAEGSKRRVAEKSPSNTDSLGFIHLVFPKARFVHCRRHPADNFVSAFQHNMNRGHDYAYDPSAYVERYLAQEEIMRYWKSCFPEQVFEMRYEEMVAQPEDMTRKLIAFCGLPWDDACLNFHQQGSTVRTFSRDQVRQPVYTSSLERWKRYGDRLEPLFAKLNQSGYDYATSRI